MRPDWPFDDPEETEVITLERILRGESPLLLVTHDLDDGPGSSSMVRTCSRKME